MEKWKAITGYEGAYEVSDLGRVRSLDRTIQHPNGPRFVRGKVLKCRKSRRGYFRVSLKSHQRQQQFSVHVLVARAFIPNPNNKPEVNHKNGKQKWNNSVSNLEWATKEENAQHASENDLVAWGSRNFGSKISTKDVLAIRKRYAAGGITQTALAKQYGIKQPQVSAIVLYQSWFGGGLSPNPSETKRIRQ